MNIITIGKIHHNEDEMLNEGLKQQACEVLLHEKLASVPENARLEIYEDGCTRFIAVGKICHDASQVLRERLEKPEWVGLTDEELSYGLQLSSNTSWLNAAKWIERKLKGKNT